MESDRTNERPLFIAVDGMSVGIAPNGNVSMRIGKPHPSLGFDPEIVFAVEMTPTEARGIAELLARKAREAEGGTSQH